MQRRQEILNDITDTVGATFLGMTYGCARCHDHKFDPILQKDYYRLQAFFANTRTRTTLRLTLADSASETTNGKYAVWEEKTKDIRAEMHKLIEPALAGLYKDNFDKFPPEIQDAITTAAAERTPIQWQMYYKAKPHLEHQRGGCRQAAEGRRREALRRAEGGTREVRRHQTRAELPVAQAMIDNGEQCARRRTCWRWAFTMPTKKRCSRDSCRSSIPDRREDRAAGATSNSTGRRTALAKWLTDPANPLTPRVMVNRIWHYHFGRGIVGTPSDFGVMGERPTHPELLDWLAAEFVESGWSIKKMHRLIMLSNTYQQSSQFNARMRPRSIRTTGCCGVTTAHRLEGEVIRDSMLAVSGLLNLKMGGPGVFPPTARRDARRRAAAGRRTTTRRRAQPAQRLHLRPAQHALSHARSLRHAGHARKLFAPERHDYGSAGARAAEQRAEATRV